MTHDELRDIWSLDFSKIWYRIWLDHRIEQLYTKKRARFFSIFIQDDGGVALRNALKNARPGGCCLWEIPRGRKYSSKETNIACAIREVQEETGINKNEYRIIPDATRKINYVSAGVRYICVYFIAVAKKHLTITGKYIGNLSRPVIYDAKNMAEIDEIRWFNIEQIRLLDSATEKNMSKLAPIITPSMRLVRNYLNSKPSKLTNKKKTEIAKLLSLCENIE